MNTLLRLAFIAAIATTGLLAQGCDSPLGSSNGVTFSNSVGSQVDLSWTASTGLPQGYNVQQSTDNVNFTQVQSVTSTSATISGLAVGKTYYFRVYAYNQAGQSASYASGQTTLSQ